MVIESVSDSPLITGHHLLSEVTPVYSYQNVFGGLRLDTAKWLSSVCRSATDIGYQK